MRVRGGRRRTGRGGPSTSGAGGRSARCHRSGSHRDGVRVTRIDAAPHGCFEAGDGIVHGREQLRPAVAVQSVGLGDESEPCRPIGGPPAEPGLVKVVVDRYTEAGELGEVVDGAARGSELEVEQRNGDAVMEDDVLADPSDLSAFW
jgi:hypothetical protein